MKSTLAVTLAALGLLVLLAAQAQQRSPIPFSRGIAAFGRIPGAEVPLDPNDGDFIPPPGTATGIARVYRAPRPFPGVPLTIGRFRVEVQLPPRQADYLAEHIVVTVSAEALHVDSSPPGSGGATAQLLIYWEVVAIDNDLDLMELEIQSRIAPLNLFADSTFSILVLIP